MTLLSTAAAISTTGAAGGDHNDPSKARGIGRFKMHTEIDKTFHR
jgi:hypothetical protein